MASGDISYLYDDADRLLAVVDAASGSAFYSYDAAGNILAIERRPSATLALVAVRPLAASVGADVTLLGTGFAATVAGNQVTMGGAAATVSSASPTQLVVKVPSGANTGPVEVRVGAASARSAQLFQVSAPAAAPRIASFSPPVVAVGGTVEIQGSALQDVVPSQFRVNGVQATPQSVVATQATLQVPPAGSGRISVWTSQGGVTSDADLFIPPAPFQPVDVEFTGRVRLDGTLELSISHSDKIALVVFDGVRDRRVSLKLSGAAVPFSAVAIYDVTGAPLWTGFSGGSGDVIGPLRLLATGSFTLLIDPDGGTTGAMTVEAYDLPEDIEGPIVPDGPSLPVSLKVPGQEARFTFDAVAGDRFGLGATNIQISDFGAVNIEVLAPDGSLVAGRTTSSVSDGADTGPVPAAGRYTIAVRPLNGSTVDLTLTLSSALRVNVVVGGPTETVNMARPGQLALARFAGTAGSSLKLVFTAVQTSGPPRIDLEMTSPSGAVIKRDVIIGAAEVVLDPLPEAGSYSLLLSPRNASTAQLSLAVQTA